MVMNKKGQDLTLGTIILIVLGVAVLVFLIWGFSTGWSNLWGKITAYTGGSNEDSIKSGCELLCTGNQEIAYCSDVKTLKKGDGTTIKGSCKNFESASQISGLSCNVNCAGGVYEQTCVDLGGVWITKPCAIDKIELTDKAKDKVLDENKESVCCQK